MFPQCLRHEAETYFAAGNNASRVAKLGNIGETRVSVQKKSQLAVLLRSQALRCAMFEF